MSVNGVCASLGSLSIGSSKKKRGKEKVPKLDVYLVDRDVSYSLPETMTLAEMYASPLFLEDAAGLLEAGRAMYVYRVRRGRALWVLPNENLALARVRDSFQDDEGVLCLRVGDTVTRGIFSLE
jgi:hypothetical protein